MTLFGLLETAMGLATFYVAGVNPTYSNLFMFTLSLVLIYTGLLFVLLGIDKHERGRA
ncbi:unnamed protein product [marine sediment metagenome]|uniref:Uncharacterized protein n=1 Tax=marine sediment metagenome TaxID=412755 RepID=X0SCT0_9ZZZZ